MDLVRDLLDARVVDRNGREMGRVDAVILATPTDGAPYVAALEIGPSALARRLAPMLGRITEGLEHAFGIDTGRPVRVPMDSVLSIGDTVKVDMTFGETPASMVEERLRRWVRRLPFA